MSPPRALRYAAFTDSGQGGNPAGVVLAADSLTDAQMLAIARAIGYSETAFVVSRAGAPDEAVIRYFSPLAEVAFCGHATVATGVAIAEREGPGALRLTTRAGPVTVHTRLDAAGLSATLTSPPTSTREASSEALTEALLALRWSAEDLDPSYPPHVSFAGNDHLVLGLASRDTLARLDYDFDALGALMARERWTTVHAFWAEDELTFHARNAFPPGGVVEDPATGAAAAAFGGYLRDLGLVQAPAGLTILQGRDMGRPSRLLVGLAPGTRSVQVTGRATALPSSSSDEVTSA